MGFRKSIQVFSAAILRPVARVALPKEIVEYFSWPARHHVALSGINAHKERQTPIPFEGSLVIGKTISQRGN
jgi:hypothetical protein